MRGLALNLDAAHAHFIAGGREHQFIAGGNTPVEYRAGDDRAAARHTERAVDGITKMLIGVSA